MTIKTIFLDRDGVINKDVNYLHKIEDFEFIDGIFEACLYFLNLNYHIIIITNQSGIYRGYFTESDYQKLTLWMQIQFKNNNINILDVFHCPHGPKSNCICRKPNPGMLIEAQIKYNIDMENSWMIGDKERDITAAIAASVGNTILLNNNQKKISLNSNAKFIIHALEETNQLITS
jgi:D-glycero-D-manno-heptose 1,7-bisphosphate phosphatase